MMIMENTRFISLSEDIDPMLWVTSSDAYNDLAAYAYQRVEMMMCKKATCPPTMRWQAT